LLSISNTALSTFSLSNGLKGSFDAAQRAGEVAENGYREVANERVISKHIAGSIIAACRTAIASLTSAPLHLRVTLERTKRASHGKAGSRVMQLSRWRVQ